MRSKIYYVAIVVVLLMGFAGPAIMSTDAQEISGLADGVYTGEAMGHNDYIEVEVSVENGKITDINITYIDDSDGLWQVAAEKIEERIINAQSTDVDTVSAATHTSEGIIAAVKDAIGEK